MAKGWKCACGIENSNSSKICGGCRWTYDRSHEYLEAQAARLKAPVIQPVSKLTPSGKKVCMACAEEIQPAALVCPHCRLNPDVIPQSKGSLGNETVGGVVKTDLGQGLGTFFKWMLIAGALGSCLAMCS